MACAKDLAELTALKAQLKAAQRLVFETILQEGDGAADLLDRQATADIFMISLPTLDRWTASESLQFPQTIIAPDGRAFYLSNDVETLKAKLHCMIDEGVKARKTGGYQAIVDLYGEKVAIWLVKTSVALRKEGKRR